MADEIKADIVFVDDTTWNVHNTVEQIKQELEGVTTPHIPLIKIVNQNGDEVWLNANHIRAFKVHDPSMPSAAFGQLGQVRRAGLN